MAVVAGIDEAGFGPVLGPLVVSASAFRIPDAMKAADMWAVLSQAVSRRPSRGARADGRVAIADSKKLYGGRKGSIEHLERGVLAALAAGGVRPATLRQLLEAVAPGSLGPLDEYPWYRGEDLLLPLAATADGAVLAGNALRQALASAGAEMLGIRCEPVFAGHYNRHVAATNNKATTLVDTTGRLMDWVWRTWSDEPLRIYVDRQGGRTRYLPFLQRLLPGRMIKVIDETSEFSAYRVPGRRADCEICFMTAGEDRRLPVALASMVSKYLREALMVMLNRYWTGRIPGLTPTAGYYTDGRRFYESILPMARKMGVDLNMLYRNR
jgi:hypothetical protein